MTPEDAVRAALQGNQDPEVRDCALAGLPEWLSRLLPMTVERGHGEPVWHCPYLAGSELESEWRLALVYTRSCCQLWPEWVRAALLGYHEPLFVQGEPPTVTWLENGMLRDSDGLATLLRKLSYLDPALQPAFDA